MGNTFGNFFLKIKEKVSTIIDHDNDMEQILELYEEARYLKPREIHLLYSMFEKKKERKQLF